MWDPGLFLEHFSKCADKHTALILGIGDSPQQAKSVQVLPEHCLRLPQMGLLYVQAVCVQEEIIYADYQDALLSIPGSWSILDHDDFLEEMSTNFGSLPQKL